MATLKSIKNKYLTASDGTVLGVTTNVENISLLSFKLATPDSLSKFNLVEAGGHNRYAFAVLTSSGMIVFESYYRTIILVGSRIQSLSGDK